MHALNAESDRKVATWLLIMCAMVFAMIVLGGVTRLTGSGLSMADWRPIMGTLPPLTEEAWERNFELYRQTPEFRDVNSHMDVQAYKGIFWLEYLHRLLGRALAPVFLIPFLIFTFKGYIRKPEWPKYALMFVLGGLQGLLGWYMVASGLVDDPRVSQYRLVSHLSAAILIYAYMFWIALGLIFPSGGGPPHPWYRKTVALTALIGATVVSGGFVAGLKAGKIYNTFPMMGDYWAPPGMWALDPWWINLFENMATVQFDHRVLAITTFALIIAYRFRMDIGSLPARLRKGVNALLHSAILQVALGIATLLLVVPVSLAALHQAIAIVLLTVGLYLCHGLRRT